MTRDKRLYQPQRMKEVLNKYNFKFTKALGQNFLMDGNIVRNIVQGAGVTAEDVVLEVGPGIGTLTEELALRAKKVYSVEIDQRLLPVLEETLKDYTNVKVIHKDILDFHWEEFLKEEEIDQKLRIVANLPYYITTPILESILEKTSCVDSITVMVQKEVAERMVAKVGDKAYGSLSLFIEYYAQAEIIGRVSRSVFMPSPDVDSAVVHLTIREKSFQGDEDLLFKLIRSGFTKRRKTILNSLTSGFVAISKSELREILKVLDLAENLRAENLSLEDYKNITNRINKN